jgi:hypothetical protein
VRYRNESIRPELTTLPGEEYIPDDWVDFSVATQTCVRTICNSGMIVVLVWQPGSWDVIAYGANGLQQDTWPDSDVSARLIGLLDD